MMPFTLTAHIYNYTAIGPDFSLLPPCSSAGSCNSGNLFCYGDFEAFESEDDAYYCQAGPPACISTLQENSVDIFEEETNENTFVHFVSIENIEYEESIFFPLAQPIQSGCTARIQFRARAEGMSDESSNATMLNFEGRRYLFDKLKNYGGPQEIPPVMKSFLIDNEGSIFDLLYTIDSAVKSATTLSDSDDVILENLGAQISEMTETITAIREDYAEATTSADSLEIFDSLVNSMAERDGLVRSSRIVLADHYEGRNEELTAIVEDIEAVETTSDPAANLLAVRAFHLRDIANDDTVPDEEDWIALHAIANQCPFEGGKAVLLARAMINPDLSVDWGEDDSCIELEKFETSVSSGTHEFIVTPNPATGHELKVSAQLNQLIDASTTRVFRGNGQEVTNQVEMQQESEFVISLALPSSIRGIVFISAVTSEGVVVTRRVLVQ